MADAPINLNRARKARARLAKARTADENAVKFGRTKAQRVRDTAEIDRLRARLDAHQRDDSAPDP